jgi:putative ABC transport system permease protein
MRLTDLIRRASRSLRSAKLRTLLTSLAIAVGGFTLTLTLAGSNGAREYADKLVANNFDPSELVVGKDPEIANTSTPSSAPREYDETVTSFGGGGGQANLQLKRLTRDDVEQD